jgi:hypothetical protein
MCVYLVQFDVCGTYQNDNNLQRMCHDTAKRLETHLDRSNKVQLWWTIILIEKPN